MDAPVGPYDGQYMAGDPREMLRERVRGVDDRDWVAMPVTLVRAVIAMRVCRATTIATGDEDGPMPPMTLHCVEQAGHGGRHYNGYMTWED